MRKSTAMRVWPTGWPVRAGQTIACPRRPRLGKRAADIVLAALLLVALSPVLLLAALAIRLDSPGPVLFRQTRVGWQGRRFRILKLRTLRAPPGRSRAGAAQVLPGDPRITRVGRWLRRTSLDELPQLVNVLRGEMSLVGPRPHALRDDLRFARMLPGYVARRQVRPGLTGPAQISGCRGAVRDARELYQRTRHDLAYLSGRSVLGDLLILLRTVVSVVRA